MEDLFTDMQDAVSDWGTCVPLTVADYWRRQGWWEEETEEWWPRRSASSSILVLNKGTLAGLAGVRWCPLRGSNPDEKLEGHPSRPGIPAAQ